MPKLRRLGGRDVARILARHGFKIVRTRGSHATLQRVSAHGVRETLTIPLHDELARGTLQAVYRQCRKFLPESQLRAAFYTAED